MGAGARAALLGAALTGAAALVVWFAIDAAETAPEVPAMPAAASAPPATSVPVRAESRPRDNSAAPANTPAPGDVRLTGQVIDDEEAPVQGATVFAVRDGARGPEVKTAADGRFTIGCGRRPSSGASQMAIVASFGDARSAFESFELADQGDPEEDLGQIQLRRAVPLTARVVDAAGPVPGARVFVGTFFGTVFSEATADAKGVAKFTATPETDAWLFAYAPGHGRARGEIPDGRDPAVPLVLTLTARTIRVSVVEVPAGVPAAGERVGAEILTETDGDRLSSQFVPPLELPPTGDTGIVTVADVGAEDAVMFRRLPRDTAAEPWRSAGRVSGTGTTSVAGPREIEARLDVFVGRTVRWRIVPGDAAAPPEGAVVTLSRGVAGWLPSMAPPALRVEQGQLVGYGFSEGDVHGVAVAPDGAIARLEPGKDARFTRPRSVVVTVRDERGAPLAGVEVTLRSAADREVASAIRTAADGVAAFEGLEPEAGLLDVWTRTETPPDARLAATVDVSKSDARAEVRLPRVIEFVLHVTTDGERKLPDSWQLYVGGSWNAAAISAPPSDLRVSARPAAPGDPVHVRLRAEGRCDAEADVFARDDGGVVHVDLACDRGATLWAVYRPAPPSARALQWCSLQTWSASEQQWTNWRDRPRLVTDRRAEPDGRFRVDALPPGRYRLLAQLGNYAYASAPADVTAGAEPPPLVLDLSRAGLVRVRVIGADDATVEHARVAVEGAGVIPQLTARDGVPQGGAGDAARAVVAVPGDRPVRLVARHQRLRAEAAQGAVEVTEPGGEYVLRLVDGPEVEFRCAVEQIAGGGTVLFRGASSAWMLLVRGDEEIPLWPELALDGRLRAGGFAPGRYTIVVRVGSGAPVVLPDVDLQDGVTDLGELRPPKGAALRLRLAVPAGQAAPALRVTVTRTSAPRYAIEFLSKGETEIVVPGLGAGRFEVVARRASQRGGDVLRRTVDCDGLRDVVIDSSPR